MANSAFSIGTITTVATDPIFTTKGDLPVGSGSATAQRLAVGTDGQIVTTDANSTLGMKWSAPYRQRLASSTQYHSPESLSTDVVATQSSAAAIQLICFWPCWAFRRMTIDALSAQCFTLESGSTLRVGLYDANQTTLAVGNLLADYGTMSGTTTGTKTVTGSQAVGPGWFFIATWGSNNSTVRWGRASNIINYPMGGTVATSRTYFGYITTSTTDYSAGLPSTPPTNIIGASNASDAAQAPIAQYRFT